MTTPSDKPIDKYQSDARIRLYSHEQLQARIKELELQNKELNHWGKIIYDEKKQLETKLQIAIQALEFYADLESWQTQGYFHRTRIVNDDSNNHDVDCNIYCGGRLARQALKEIKEE